MGLEWIFAQTKEKKHTNLWIFAATSFDDAEACMCASTHMQRLYLSDTVDSLKTHCIRHVSGENVLEHISTP